MTTGRFAAAIGRAVNRLCTDKRNLICPEKERKKRQRICGKCASKRYNFCTECHCLLPVKIALATEKCEKDNPAWDRVDII